MTINTFKKLTKIVDKKDTNNLAMLTVTTQGIQVMSSKQFEGYEK